MHYVLVWWFKETVSPRMRGYCGLVVYADDFVACFQYKEDAEYFYEHLVKRMKHFGLSLEEEKSRLIKFGRFAQSDARAKGIKADTFVFLGFTHYCSTSRNGKFRVKRKTVGKKLSKKSKEVYQLIKSMRTQRIPIMIRKLNQILVGYYHYYGITEFQRNNSLLFPCL